MKTKAPLTIVLLVLFALLANALAFAAKDTLNTTPQTSGNGVKPTRSGNSNEWFYVYCLPSGSGLSDTFPIKFSVDDTDGTPGDTYTIGMSTVGGLAGYTSVPGPFSISDDGAVQTQTASINIPAGALADGQYAVNIKIDCTTRQCDSNLANAHAVVHVQVVIGGVCNGTGATCFFTDSDFNFLLDCSGNDVTGNSGGTFQIVGNAKGRVVATNPGQFYYNLIWKNSGATQPVTINLAATGLNPMGANSVHALTFNSSGFTQDVTNFDMVNQDGTPCGQFGPCTLTVNSGDVLWVTWHLEFAGIGSNISLYSNVCPGNAAGAITATGTLTDASGNVLATCGASANGYAK